MVHVIQRQCIDICMLKWVCVDQSHAPYVTVIELTIYQRGKKFLVR